MGIAHLGSSGSLKCSLKLEEKQGDGCRQVASQTLLKHTNHLVRASKRHGERENRQININDQTA